MRVYLGETRKKDYLTLMELAGWGRIWTERTPKRAWRGEPCAFDNGAFVAWRRGLPFPEGAFLKRVGKVQNPPDWAVCPDIVGDVGSLAFSVSWLGRLPAWDWYLAVQDGMTPAMVAPYVGLFSGIFLGGSDDFKETAPAWGVLAKDAGVKFHFGRCNNMSRLMLAHHAGADSIDTAAPLWEWEKLLKFARWYLCTMNPNYPRPMDLLTPCGK